MEQNNATQVESITELLEGDKVRVSGNGLDVETTVGEISFSTWNYMMTATVKADNGNSYRLIDADHPLQSDGITSNVGAVTVKRLE